MNMELLAEMSVSEIGISGMIIAVIAVLTLLGFLRGLVKLIFLIFTIAGACYAAYWGADEGLKFLQKSWPGTPIQLGNVFAVICGLVAFYLLSKIFGFFTDPFENSGFLSKIAFGVPAAMISLIAATALVWLSLNLLKDKGSEGEIQYWITQDDEIEDARMKHLPTLSKLKASFENSNLGRKMANIYQLHDLERHNLAKLVVIAHASPEKMTEIATDERVKNIVSDIKFKKLLRGGSMNKVLSENDVGGVLDHPLLYEALIDQDFAEELGGLRAGLFQLRK